MNPSASGWIHKFGFLSEKQPLNFPSFEALYENLRGLGFAYGINTGIPDFIVPTHALTQDEQAKINLLYGLYNTYKISNPDSGFNSFLDSLYKFYHQMGLEVSFLQKVLVGGKKLDQLEKLIDSRVYPEANLLTKIFNPTLTNSLLFIDILTYRQYLKDTLVSRNHASELEYLVLNITYEALDSKRKTASDDKLRELFQSSLTFLENPSFQEDFRYRDILKTYKGTEAAMYFLDVACLTVWDDDVLELQESRFVLNLGTDLSLTPQIIHAAILNVGDFYSLNAGHLEVFREHNSFDTLTQLVQKLIKRNSKRLQRELSQSRELVYLLSKATVKELTDSERNKIREQLADIFKSIPSLAIFMLPGGAVLLPIFIKLIPRLLPSSFDENRVEKE